MSGFELTHDQQAHLDRMKRHIEFHFTRKFLCGAKEHGGDMRDYDTLVLIDNAIEENLDSLAYLLTIREKITNGGR